jgi:hypothetical protein
VLLAGPERGSPLRGLSKSVQLKPCTSCAEGSELSFEPGSACHQLSSARVCTSNRGGYHLGGVLKRTMIFHCFAGRPLHGRSFESNLLHFVTVSGIAGYFHPENASLAVRSSGYGMVLPAACEGGCCRDFCKPVDQQLTVG